MSRMRITYFFRRDWFASAFKVALIVGTLLFIINHGSALYAHEMNFSRWCSAGLSYLVPYCVYIVGKVSNLRKEQKEIAAERGD